jgi:predicted nucleotidyltransferase
MVVSEDTLSRMVEAIVDGADPEQIYLFGSQSKGLATEESDVDLLIVKDLPDDPNRRRFDEINRIHSILSPFKVPVDILLYSSSEVRRWRDSPNHVIGRCLREGKALYARP